MSNARKKRGGKIRKDRREIEGGIKAQMRVKGHGRRSKRSSAHVIFLGTLRCQGRAICRQDVMREEQQRVMGWKDPVNMPPGLQAPH
ncbi:hypothetical protein FQN60_002651 [Etheostoma spectabile]|uniref:Uncharacterized protein n=1 Tax=Etheostoma spectabile TaxID=54343 RepID=A0A5J5CLB4_9PERO|nr:hypothetical protein FQN60_002651 [Etheostoma spectabile]